MVRGSDAVKRVSGVRGGGHNDIECLFRMGDMYYKWGKQSREISLFGEARSIAVLSIGRSVVLSHPFANRACELSLGVLLRSCFTERSCSSQGIPIQEKFCMRNTTIPCIHDEVL
jgi:hypothetical protein